MKAVFPVRFFLLAFAVIFVSACGGVPRKVHQDLFGLDAERIPASEQKEISRAIALLTGKNAGLTTVKGLGNLKMYDAEKSGRSRLAWVVDAFGRIRMELLGIGGQPVLSVAVDDARLYALVHGENRFYTRNKTDDALALFLPVALPVDAVTALLMGRVPLPRHRVARYTEGPAGNGYVLTLAADSGVVERIFFDQDKSRVTDLEFYREDGTLMARVVVERYREVQSYRFFSKITVMDDNRSGLELDMERLWVNMPVDPSAFRLSEDAVGSSEKIH